MFRCGKTLLALALLMTIPVAVSAQTADNPPAPSSPAQPASQPPPTVELLKPEQLEALVAPIALYPDELLANVLAASTYPLEVVQADRWLKARKALKGDALRKEVERSEEHTSALPISLSRRTAGKCTGGVDLSAGSGAGRPLAQGTQGLEGRCVEEGGRETVLGRQRQGALEHRRRHFDDERQDRLDQEPGRCRARAAGGRDGCDPAPALQGL